MVALLASKPAMPESRAPIQAKIESEKPKNAPDSEPNAFIDQNPVGYVISNK